MLPLDPPARRGQRVVAAAGHGGVLRQRGEVLDVVDAHTEPGPLRDRLYLRWYRGKVLSQRGSSRPSGTRDGSPDRGADRRPLRRTGGDRVQDEVSRRQHAPRTDGHDHSHQSPARHRPDRRLAGAARRLRARAARGPIALRVLVPNPAPAEWHPAHPERHAKADGRERVLRESLPELREAAGVPVDGTVSTRHDPLDAIEELLQDEPVDELIVATDAASHRGLAARRPPAPRDAPRAAGDDVAGTRPLELRRTATPLGGAQRRMLNKVPEVTLYFWIIKIMCTTVGETAADYLNENLGFGLSKTTYVSAALLAVLLVVQFRLRRYVPGRLLVGGRRDLGLRHADHGQHDRPLQRAADHEHADLRRRAGDRVRGLVGLRAHALDPHDLHDAARGVLLAGDPVHVRARHRGRRPDGGEAVARLRRLDRDLRRDHRA